ncbi:MAG: hypothetical protein AAGG48_08960 [Planctomycetota bacterium]
MSLPPATGTPSATTNSSTPIAGGQPSPNLGFVERRGQSGSQSGRPERRQFGSSHSGLSEAGRELALAIDQYKVNHHRRYLTCDEMLTVLTELGYQKQPS